MSTTLVHTLKHRAGVPGRDTADGTTRGIFVALPKRLYATVVRWQQRYELRRHLLTLDDRLVEDFGLTPVDAEREAAKPFWQE